MLSEQERRALEAIELQLQADDPALCRRLDQPLDRAARSRRRWLAAATVGALVIGLASAVLGLLAFSLGLVFFGCLVAAASWTAFLVLRNRPLQRPAGGATATGWTWA
ncbi:DUF3040 domain-containing protein [Pseudonocardia sp. CA-107938]|uniref:DUF3040 domain-containing protein n=1 Tax=Pseudonocardia sp. CA-107938 TaxID=3240021 RepID=UPI003D8CE6D8